MKAYGTRKLTVGAVTQSLSTMAGALRAKRGVAVLKNTRITPEEPDALGGALTGFSGAGTLAQVDFSVLEVVIPDLLDPDGIIAENPFDTPVQLAEQAVF